MPGWGVTPSIRVQDIKGALAYYTETLGFEVLRDSPEGDNYSLGRGDARIMLEPTSASFYSDAYNQAIRERAGQQSASALYIEAEDFEALYERLVAGGAAIIDPLAERPWGQAEFTVADLEGNWLSFYKSLPKA